MYAVSVYYMTQNGTVYVYNVYKRRMCAGRAYCNFNYVVVIFTALVAVRNQRTSVLLLGV